MKSSRILLLSIIGLCLLLNVSAVFGKTWTVDDDLQDYQGADFSIIQEAINSAMDGDEIIIYSGTYNENIIIDKSIKLLADGEYDEVIIQAEKGDNARAVFHSILRRHQSLPFYSSPTWLGLT